MSVEGCHVLVVDDDEMNRDMLSRRLLRHGYAVTVAQDGKQALALVTEHAFDLIVLDVMMPELDGLQVLQTLRKTYSMADLPVIMATARDRTEDVVHALQLGANDYVSKPLDFAVLAARVDTQLTLKRAHHATDGTPGQRAGDQAAGAATVATAAVARPVWPLPVHESDVRGSRSIGRYQIVECIGSGGMGAVYLARDPWLDRPVAIKLLREEIDSSELRERFGREARAAARLTHRNIVSIYDVGDHGGRPFIAMEFVPGETLAQHIRRQTLPLDRRLALIEELCDGLEHAHRAGVVHHDIKPQNLMLTPEGVLKILDFGIARLVEVHPPSLTPTHVILGSVSYMSPERFGGQIVDHRSDIFAVGAVLYELLSGKKAFPGNVGDGVIQHILLEAPEPLPLLCPGLDPDIAGIVDRALKKDAQDRYPDVTTMRRDVASARQRVVEAASTPLAVVLVENSDASGGQSDAPLADLDSTFALLESARRGDEQALERLFARHLEPLRRWASGRLPTWARDRGDTDDLVQDALFRTLKKIDDFEPRRVGALQAYLRQAVRNRVLDELRRTGRQPEVTDMDDLDLEGVASPLEDAIGRETVEAYQRALETLKPEERKAVILRVEMGYGYEELAQVLGKPTPDAARKMVQRALERLAKEMKPHRSHS
jgi:RNA polymerase sigma factor (sigma-70 family)